MYSYRNLINDRSEELLEQFILAWEARARLQADAVVETDETSLPNAREAMAAAFMGTRLLDKYRNLTGSDKTKHDWKYKR